MFNHQPLSYINDNNYEGETMGSVNHSLVQTRLIRHLPDEDKFTIATELSLDVSGLGEEFFKTFGTMKELKPDICLYPPGVLDFISPAVGFDLTRFNRPPQIAIEIVSPTQPHAEIIAKFLAYFKFGVTSCWLVDPATLSIFVYSSPLSYQVFSNRDSEIVDATNDIRVSMKSIFPSSRLGTEGEKEGKRT